MHRLLISFHSPISIAAALYCFNDEIQLSTGLGQGWMEKACEESMDQEGGAAHGPVQWYVRLNAWWVTGNLGLKCIV